VLTIGIVSTLIAVAAIMSGAPAVFVVFPTVFAVVGLVGAAVGRLLDWVGRMHEKERDAILERAKQRNAARKLDAIAPDTYRRFNNPTAHPKPNKGKPRGPGAERKRNDTFNDNDGFLKGVVVGSLLSDDTHGSTRRVHDEAMKPGGGSFGGGGASGAWEPQQDTERRVPRYVAPFDPYAAVAADLRPAERPDTAPEPAPAPVEVSGSASASADASPSYSAPDTSSSPDSGGSSGGDSGGGGGGGGGGGD
jgi:uncharacterized membrane protein YgcG